VGQGHVAEVEDAGQALRIGGVGKQVVRVEIAMDDLAGQLGEGRGDMGLKVRDKGRDVRDEDPRAGRASGG
jgi:hypothetical protein